MRRIHVQTLVQWERDRIIIQRRVRRGVVRLDRRLCETGDELLDVADPLGACEWGTEGGCVPEVEVEAGRERWI